MFKKLLLGATVAVAAASGASAFAQAEGAYISGQLGLGIQHIADSSMTDGAFTLTSIVDDNKGIAGRVAAGYNFSENLAVEAGFVKYSDAKLKNYAEIGTAKGSGKFKIKTYQFDLLAKGTVQMADNFALFGKAGLAYIKGENSCDNIVVQGFPPIEIRSETQNSIRPKLAIGASYYIDDSTSIDASYSRTFGKGDIYDDGYLPNLDLLSLGITYNFS